MQLEDKFSLLQGQILTFVANACGLFDVNYCRSDVGFSGKQVLQLRLSCQVAGGGGVRSPNGEVVGDCITGGSAKKIILLVQRDQILLARSYFLCEDAPGRMSM